MNGHLRRAAFVITTISIGAATAHAGTIMRVTPTGPCTLDVAIQFANAQTATPGATIADCAPDGSGSLPDISGTIGVNTIILDGDASTDVVDGSGNIDVTGIEPGDFTMNPVLITSPGFQIIGHSAAESRIVRAQFCDAFAGMPGAGSCSAPAPCNAAVEDGDADGYCCAVSAHGALDDGLVHLIACDDGAFPGGSPQQGLPLFSMQEGLTVTLEDVAILGAAKFDGFAVADTNGQGPTLVLAGVNIESTFGGASIVMRTLSASDTDFVANNSSIGNQALFSSTFGTFDNCRFVANEVNRSVLENQSTSVVTGSSFIDNNAAVRSPPVGSGDQSGVAYANTCQDQLDCGVSDTLFLGNGNAGSAAALAVGPTIVINNVFVDNVGIGTAAAVGSGTFSGNVVVANRVPGFSEVGHIVVFNGVVEDNVFEQNTCPAGALSVPLGSTVRHNAFRDNQGTPILGFTALDALAPAIPEVTSGRVILSSDTLLPSAVHISGSVTDDSLDLSENCFAGNSGRTVGNIGLGIPGGVDATGSFWGGDATNGFGPRIASSVINGEDLSDDVGDDSANDAIGTSDLVTGNYDFSGAAATDVLCPARATCTVDADCPGRVCEAGECRLACSGGHAQPVCPGADVCDVATDTCVPDAFLVVPLVANGGTQLGEVCPATCAQGNECTGGVCVVPAGVAVAGADFIVRSEPDPTVVLAGPLGAIRVPRNTLKTIVDIFARGDALTEVDELAFFEFGANNAAISGENDCRIGPNGFDCVSFLVFANSDPGPFISRTIRDAPTPPEDCGNDFDDDGDGLSDCADPACTGIGDCTGEGEGEGGEGEGGEGEGGEGEGGEGEGGEGEGGEGEGGEGEGGEGEGGEGEGGEGEGGEGEGGEGEGGEGEGGEGQGGEGEGGEGEGEGEGGEGEGEGPEPECRDDNGCAPGKECNDAGVCVDAAVASGCDSCDCSQGDVRSVLPAVAALLAVRGLGRRRRSTR